MYLGPPAAVISVLEVVHGIGAQREPRPHGLWREAELQSIGCEADVNSPQAASLSVLQLCVQDCTPPWHNCCVLLIGTPALMQGSNSVCAMSPHPISSCLCVLLHR